MGYVLNIVLLVAVSKAGVDFGVTVGAEDCCG
jgi:hypothetical protein